MILGELLHQPKAPAERQGLMKSVLVMLIPTRISSAARSTLWAILSSSPLTVGRRRVGQPLPPEVCNSGVSRYSGAVREAKTQQTQGFGVGRYQSAKTLVVEVGDVVKFACYHLL